MAGAAVLRDDPKAMPGLAHRLRNGPILIAGGGIGGLAAALALARYDIPSVVLERRPTPAEAGAGIQIGPNGTAILEELGVAPLLREVHGAPRAIAVHDAVSGRLLARLPLGSWIADRHGSPYWVTHRQDLHAALLARARSIPLIGLHVGAEILAPSQAQPGGPQVEVLAEDGRRWLGSALIGADGLWSNVRRAVTSAQPLHAGLSAVRTTIPADRKLVTESQLDVGVWMHPQGHVVHYPVRGGREVAVVGIFPDTPGDAGWDTAVARAWVEQRMAPFPAAVRALVAGGAEWRKWGLYALPRGVPWAKGSVALLGDAVHPVLPFLAQGAVLALEDAVVLADAIAHEPSIPQALRRYARARAARARRVAAASRRNGRIYHLDGTLAAARNLALTRLPAARIMTQYDWLYGWRAGV
jgi:salicylate hydroxylase